MVDTIDIYTILRDGERTEEPENGVFIVFLGELTNQTTEEECVKSYHWDLFDTSTNAEYDWAFNAESILRERYGLDYPGTFFGLCIEPNESVRTFVPYDVDPNASVSLSLLDYKDGVPVNFGFVQAWMEPIEEQSTIAADNSGATPSNPTLISGVVQQTANLRGGPGPDFPIVGSAEAGDEVQIFSRNFDGSWLQVGIDPEVWIWVQLVETSQDVASLPTTPLPEVAETDLPVSPPMAQPIATTASTAGASDWLEYHGLKIGVREVRWDYSLNYFTPQEGMIYFSAYIIAVNESDVEETFFESDIEVVDGGGEVRGDVIFGYVSPRFSSCTVKPGGVCEGWWTTQMWDRPEVRENLLLRWEPSWVDPALETEIRQ
ncbi:MAG: SH3 domain-containing protein [Chloroflexi bacterium]|nr:SH3 domain-containing protein [Chloroflexota bacterium]